MAFGTALGRRVTTCAIVALLAFNSLNLPVAAQVDPLGGLALGAGLTIFGNKVEEILQQATGEGLILEIQAGGQVSTVISQAQTAYQADLSLTFDKLSAVEQQTVSDIKGLVDQYSQQIYGQMKSITMRAQQVANTLPLRNGLPQLTSFGPTYATQDVSTVVITADGNFPDLSRSGYDASALINGKTYSTSAKTTQHLEFSIPKAGLAASQSIVSPNFVMLTVPYWKREFLLLGHKDQSTFTFPFVVLPVAVGSIDLATSVVAPGTTSKDFTTQEFRQESGDDDIKCGGEHGDLAVHSQLADPGWTIIPSSAKWNVTWHDGKEGPNNDWWLDHNCTTPTTACMCVSTEHHRFGTSGKVHFTITYTATSPTTSIQTTDTSYPLSWNNRLDLTFPVGGSYNLTIRKFDGTTQSVKVAPYNSPLINIYSTGTTLSIYTAPQTGVVGP
jgi:hypothetical protein